MDKAFVLGAGLGTRLRPLTARVPKPLIPVFHRPLITYAFDHLLAAGVREFIVNTHHLPEKFAEAFPGSRHGQAPITFRHEPVLLETAGGIANITDLLRDEPFIVYNGDILTDLPLAPLLERHAATGNLITLVLRSRGPGLHVALDAPGGWVTDIRNRLGTGKPCAFQFTGIYAVSPAFLRHLTPGKIESVVPVFLRLIAAGRRIGGVVVDEGHWWDLGSRQSYLDAHRDLDRLRGRFAAPAAGGGAARHFGPPIENGARIDPTAILRGLNVISAGAVVEERSEIEDCILWPGARVAGGARLRRCIVLDEHTARGDLADADV